MTTAVQIPRSFGRELRCRLVKTYDQVHNIPTESVGEFTTHNITGIISVMDPAQSWAARWLQIGKFVPACYTLDVSEVLSEEIQSCCEENGVTYIPPKREYMRIDVNLTR